MSLELTHPISVHPVTCFLSQKTPRSAACYQSHLETIASIVSVGRCNAMTLDWSKLRYEHTAQLRAVLIKRYSGATVNLMLSALRGVLKECKKLKLISNDDYVDAVSVDSVRKSTKMKGRALSSEERQSLFLLFKSDRTLHGIRDKALLAVLLGTGIRRGELVALDYKDFNPDWNALQIREGKGGKNRTVYLPDWAIPVLHRWLEFRGDSPGPLFFPINKGGNIIERRLTGQAIFYIIKKRAESVDMEQFSPHDFRRTFISELLDAGIDIVTVQKLAGHSSPETTARYDRRGEDTKRKAVQKIDAPF